MKVMIVEDEPLLRQGLIRKINWQALGLRLAGEANDGFEALSKLAGCQPDIVLTDIRMPGMDGLQFIQQARSQSPHLKFVIISGFNEFEYVRTALQFNVKDYLLKPIDKEKLHGLLADLCKELREERKDAADLSQLHELGAWIRQSHLQPQDFQLTHLISEPNASWDGIPSAMPACRQFAAAVARIQRSENSRFGPEEGALARFAVQNVLANTLQPLEGMASVVFKHAYHQEEIVALLGSAAIFSLECLTEALTEASAWISRHLGLTVSIGISGRKEELTQLRFAYHDARKTLQSRLLLGSGSICAQADAGREAADPSPRMMDEAERVMPAMLDEGAYREFHDYAGSLFRRLAESPDARYDQVEFVYAEVMRMLRKHAARLGTSVPGASAGSPDASLEQFSDWREILAAIDLRLKHLESAGGRGADRSCDDIIEHVKQHIKEHYAEDLPLQWVAETYYIHPNYFSKRFKLIVGVCYSDYVTGIRMKRAQELLRTTTLKIARISQLVGYEDQNYFCNVFKKTAGVSPSAYRGC